MASIHEVLMKGAKLLLARNRDRKYRVNNFIHHSINNVVYSILLSNCYSSSSQLKWLTIQQHQNL